jgi:hypothetical protein
MVPVSATMQPTKLVVLADAELLDTDAGVDEPDDDGAELLLLPHAATASVAETASAAMAHALCFTLPPLGWRQ